MPETVATAAGVFVVNRRLVSEVDLGLHGTVASAISKVTMAAVVLHTAFNGHISAQLDSRLPKACEKPLEGFFEVLHAVREEENIVADIYIGFAIAHISWQVDRRAKESRSAFRVSGS